MLCLSFSICGCLRRKAIMVLVPLTGTFADPVGSIGSINPNLPQRLYNWFTFL